MKKLVIIKPNCHKLENHLWNYLGIYAYSIEIGTRVFNPSFFKWHRYFNLYTKESLMTKIVSFVPALHGFWWIILTLYGSYLVRFSTLCVRLTSGTLENLPPTVPERALDPCSTTYFIGWLFRNLTGLERHRDALITAFTPREAVLKYIKNALEPLRGKQLIGIHIRQQPYKGFEDESFVVEPVRVRHILNEYLHEWKIEAKDVALVIVSDVAIDQSAFAGYLTFVMSGNDVASLFLLSKCRVVIGTNSTFSNLAAWFGNVPHVVTTNEQMDWAYYENTTTYFQNKYATFAL